MKLAEILSNEELRRHEFPVARDKVFLGHAGVCPLPRRVAAAVRDYAELATQGDQETLWPAHRLPETRGMAARLLSAKPEEIALLGPTSLGLSLVAAGLDWKPGDNLIVHFDDFPANVYPWLALQERGVEVRLAKPARLGEITVDEIRPLINARTRLAALGSCHFISGFKIDLPALSEFLRSKNVLFCLDAIQTLGAFPIDAQQLDFLAADAHKWLLGPCGEGIFYVRKELQEQLRPAILGWHNVRCPNYIAQEQMIFRPDARRYEPGTQNLLGAAAIHAALELLLEIGIDAIESELLRKRAWLIPALQAKGYEVLNDAALPKNSSSIISFSKPQTDLAALWQRLDQENIITSLRTDRAGRRYIRISPHFYNSDTELKRFLDVLDRR